ncbi:XRE family transcriptional regulator [Ornithinimicrobium sp. F0845]|uniref:helix-turn-helix domain-containing protein n=1 Tax=Ornithinimicrobium sp. F0845 TaxID=2926412 RepID=UPI001FF4485C|nr:XRE family transcriptional regulator [Ornithinimicrobium sp. F0845]MCK0114058.1 XRE family transcriptional regulator [Ornithinimicrobium sp. F0845]
MSTLGTRLAELRHKHGYTLRALAAEAGLSPALLSQLENGTTDPSLSTLRKLAGVFDTSIATLFGDPDAPMVHLSRPGERVRLTAPTGNFAYDRVTPGRGDLEVLHVVMAPGDQSSAEGWAHQSTECAYVISGEVTVELSGERRVLTAGQALTFDSQLPHRYLNASTSQAEMILSVTPPTP